MSTLTAPRPSAITRGAAPCLDDSDTEAPEHPRARDTATPEEATPPLKPARTAVANALLEQGTTNRPAAQTCGR